jgi:hypothetical protein
MSEILTWALKCLLYFIVGLWIALTKSAQSIITLGVLLILIPLDASINFSSGNKAVQLVIVLAPVIYCTVLGAGRRQEK